MLFLYLQMGRSNSDKIRYVVNNYHNFVVLHTSGTLLTALIHKYSVY